METTFKKYVDESVVNEIVQNRTLGARIGGVKKDIAVLFVDIRGFTSLSESLDPEQIVAVGSTNGTGVICIGKARDKDFINECFDKCLSNANRRLEDYSYKLESLMFASPKVGANKRKTRESICKDKVQLGSFNKLVAITGENL